MTRPAGTFNQHSFAAILSLRAKFKAARERQGQALAETAERMGIDAPGPLPLGSGQDA